MNNHWRITLAALMIAASTLPAGLPAMADGDAAAVSAASDTAFTVSAASATDTSADPAAVPTEDSAAGIAAPVDAPAATAPAPAAPVDAPAAPVDAPAASAVPAAAAETPAASAASAPAASAVAPANVQAASTSAAAPAAPTNTVYPLTDSIQAELKSLSLSKTATGTTIGAAVRLRNTATQMNRVPDYELRVKLADGSEYTMQASATNERSIQAKENADMTYMVTIDRQDELTVTGVSFTQVDEYVYPKQETVLLQIPAASVWNGSKADITDPSANKAWGETFTIPGSVSPIRFTPTELSEQNDDKGARTVVVTMLAENPGAANETMSVFRLDGKTADKVYTGSRIETGDIVLAPGEKKYVHFAIPVDNGATLQNLLLMTSEMFTPAATAAGQTKPATMMFDVGRLKLAMPASGAGAAAGMTPIPYAIGTPIPFDPLNKLVNADTKVSLVELHMHGGDQDGYKTVVAKFKLSNESSLTVPLPNFQAELVGSDGSVYAGSRQTTTATNLMPNLGYVMNYSFMVPDTENGQQLAIRLLDNVTTAPYSSAIAAVQTAVQQDTDSDIMSFYPFTVKLNDWQLSAFTNGGVGQGLTYSYKMKLDLTVSQEDNVVVDQNFSKFKIELVDGLGRTLGSETVPFVGANKLISGEQTVQIGNLKTEQLEYPLTINLYESIDTPNGEVKRLVKTLKQ
ncbi:hypothetical protein [Paenibacillus hamazuiensis]|uniref:hypothetical protein n=1 Tax=Paenibacillus hamazuiensis TaxID=2936508 RepID=UPI00200DAEA5|nr:hypothetical protein [Paenibacillus hamazuiensis]